MTQRPLTDHAEVPLPAGLTALTLTTRDGYRLRAAHLLPDAAPRGSIALFQGRSEYIERYADTLGDLAARGFALAAFDWRGQGRSDRVARDPRQGHVRDAADYEADAAAFLKGVVTALPAPRFALGHSMGALVLARLLRGADQPFERAVLLSPLLGFGPQYSRVGLKIVPWLAALGLGELYARGGATPQAWLPFTAATGTSDEERYGRYARLIEAAPDLGIGGASVGWVGAMLRAGAQLMCPGSLERIRTPVLIITGSADEAISAERIREAVARIPSAGHLVIDGARHELLQERAVFRAQALAAIDAFCLPA